MPEKNAWYTPAPFAEAARATMGDIDLDPACCEYANRVIQARRFFTKEENGLSHEWHGRVFLNPPFNEDGLTTLKDWTRKLQAEYASGNVEQALLLIPKPMRKCIWFYELYDYPMCHVRDRIKFYSDTLTREEPANVAYCVVYFGSNVAAFIEHFSQFGRITGPLDNPIAQQHLWRN